MTGPVNQGGKRDQIHDLFQGKKIRHMTKNISLITCSLMVIIHKDNSPWQFLCE